MSELWELFWVFARIGSLTFGGGYAMLPMIQREIVDKKKWATEEQILNYYALGQATPGIIAVNTATFVGYERRGVAGGIVATLGMVFPSLVIISLLAHFISRIEDLPTLQHAFAGIRVAVVALVVSAVLRLWKQSVKNAAGALLFVASFAVISFIDVSPVAVVLAAAVLGVSYAWYVMKRNTAGGEAS